jgi:hypothetical protein
VRGRRDVVFVVVFMTLLQRKSVEVTRYRRLRMRVRYEVAKTNCVQ